LRQPVSALSLSDSNDKCLGVYAINKEL
jgi:hypothetical protein